MTHDEKLSSGSSGLKEGSERGERQSRVVRTFMTQNMDDNDILSLETGRDEELARIIDAIDRSRKAAPGTLQHVVLYGNRGFGKSFMTRRVQIEVASRWPGIPFLLLPEEQHSLQRNPHALLDTITLKLADSRSGGDTAYDEGHFRWPTADETARRWDEAVARVEQALDASLPDGGIVVVVVENFDILLRRLFREDVDEQRLRSWLDRKGNRLMLFATATGTVDMEYDRPLFQAFEPVRLEPWSGDECIAYFNRLRAHQGLERLGPEYEAKARAVADFIGGTPRLAQLLGGVLESGDALEVAEIMAALTDRLADYYRRRIEDLAPLSIGLLDALIRGGEPASQTELAARVGAGGQSDIARVMSELQRADIVRGIAAPDSREKLYRVPDRVFVHYYRLRQGSRAAQETPLATILDFLRSFYSREERRFQSLVHLEAGRLPEAGLFSRLAREGTAQSRDFYTHYFVDDLRLYLEAAPGAIGKSAEEVAALLEGDRPEDAYKLCQGEEQTGAAGAVRAAIRAQALYRLGHAGKAGSILESALGHTRGNAIAGFIVLEQLFLLTATRDLADAARVTEALDNLGDNLPQGMETRRVRHRAFGHLILGRHEEAAETAARAAILAAKAGDTRGEAVCLRRRAFSLGQLGRHEEAAETAARAAILAADAGDSREEAEGLRHRAFSLGQLGRYEEAWIDAQKSMDIARKGAYAYNLGWSIRLCLDVASHLARPEIVALFGEWLHLYMTSDARDLPEPRWSFGELFAAVAQAGAWSALDALVEEHAAWLAAMGSPVWFDRSVGEAFARIGLEKGRAAGYEAMAEALPRIAKLMEQLPEKARDRSWLPDIAAGFAEGCHDPGLLRDVATLMTPEIAPQAEETARLLRSFAEVEEAATPEIALARMDPDIATLIRHLRNLPNPEPSPSVKKARGMKRG